MIPVVAFVNNNNDEGRTRLVYHLAWKLADLRVQVLAADLDPQANLTRAFLNEDELEELWPETSGDPDGGVARTSAHRIVERLWLLPSDVSLSSIEEELSLQWLNCLQREEQAFRATSAFWRKLQHAASLSDAELILMDVGPNLGAINRAALIAADFVVYPVAPDLFSLRCLRALGPAIGKWRGEWQQRLTRNPNPSLRLPKGDMSAAGYVILQHPLRLDRPVQLHSKWLKLIPVEYARSVDAGLNAPGLIAVLKHYGNLMQMAEEARKPIFHLKPADGAMGAHLTAARVAGKEYELLALELMSRVGLNGSAAPPEPQRR